MTGAQDQDGKPAKPRAKRTSSDFKVDLNKANPSPLDFIQRRMAEEDAKARDAESDDAADGESGG